MSFYSSTVLIFFPKFNVIGSHSEVVERPIESIEEDKGDRKYDSGKFVNHVHVLNLG